MPDGGATPFTPEAYPSLSPEVCAFLNTPVEDCDPDLLRVVLDMLAQHIADSVPAELGLDAKALFAELWGSLGSELDPDRPDIPPAEAPPAPPATLKPATPDAVSPARGQGQGTEPADDAALAEGAAPDIMPDAAAPNAAVPRANRSPSDRDRRVRHHRLWSVRCRRSRPRRRRATRQPLPPRRLCYAACAGPP